MDCGAERVVVVGVGECRRGKPRVAGGVDAIGALHVGGHRRTRTGADEHRFWGVELGASSPYLARVILSDECPVGKVVVGATERRRQAFVLIRVHAGGKEYLAEIGEAIGGAAGFACFAQGRE